MEIAALGRSGEMLAPPQGSRGALMPLLADFRVERQAAEREQILQAGNRKTGTRRLTVPLRWGSLGSENAPSERVGGNSVMTQTAPAAADRLTLKTKLAFGIGSAA